MLAMYSVSLIALCDRIYLLILMFVFVLFFLLRVIGAPIKTQQANLPV